MITSQEEAIELAAKYQVSVDEFPNAVVTANSNIYTTDRVDPKDDSEKFYLKVEQVEQVEKQKSKKK